MKNFKYNICIIGGAGHVGLPLALAFSERGMDVCIYDIDRERLEKIKNKKMPFLEEGGEEILKKTLNKTLFLSESPTAISESKFIFVVIGTPIDEHLNPEFTLITKTLEGYLPYFRKNQILILRSTVYPGTTANIQKLLKKKGLKINVSFCPERIVEGKALKELRELPQIISAFDKKTLKEVSKLFLKITKEVIILNPIEAELAKLFTNAWRYIKFAISNQFYMIAQQKGVDFYRIYKAIVHNYPRASDLPSAGFTAGPCLLKDTMQLAAFNQNNFPLGISAMFINEGMPNFLVEQLKSKYDLKQKTIGILGMAFKANSDDKRESLSYKLKKILETEVEKVLCSDEYIKDKDFVSPEYLIKHADIIILATPHQRYKKFKNCFRNKILIDIWNFYEEN